MMEDQSFPRVHRNPDGLTASSQSMIRALYNSNSDMEKWSSDLTYPTTDKEDWLTSSSGIGDKIYNCIKKVTLPMQDLPILHHNEVIRDGHMTKHPLAVPLHQVTLILRTLCIRGKGIFNYTTDFEPASDPAPITMKRWFNQKPKPVPLEPRQGKQKTTSQEKAGSTNLERLETL